MWLNRIFATSGEEIFYLALIFSILKSTQSVLNSSFVIAFSTIPLIFISPFLGVYVDRFDKKYLLVISAILEAFVVSSLIFLKDVEAKNVYFIYVVVIILYTITSLDSPSFYASVPLIVEKESLIRANSLLSVTNRILQILTSLFGGLMLATLGNFFVILFALSAYLAASVSIGFVRMRLKAIKENMVTEPTANFSSSDASVPQTTSNEDTLANKKDPSKKEATTFLSDFKEGISRSWSDHTKRGFVLLGSWANFVEMGQYILLPALILLVFHQNATIMGLAWASLFGGYVIGASVLPKLKNVKSMAGRFYLFSLTLTGLCILATGLISNLVLVLIITGFSGFFANISSLTFRYYFQAVIDKSYFGRVFSAVISLFGLTTIISMLFAGILSDYWAVSSILALYGAMLIVPSLISVLFSGIRRAGY
jgi:DHA3 family macrolide efflux protein-like MFS transporter